MKILFVSGCAPATFNTGEPNSYPYYLIKELAKNNELYVLYFNANKKLTTQNISIALKDAGVYHHRELKTSSFLKLLTYGRYIASVVVLKLFLLLKIDPPKIMVPVPLSVYKKKYAGHLTEVTKEFKPELAIFFPLLLQFAIKKVTKLNVPVSLLCTDSGALHFTRLMKVQGANSADHKKNFQHFIQFQKLENNYGKINATYFFVGEKDKESFVLNSKQEKNCYFIPHHLYSYSTHIKNWNNLSEPLNVVFAGGGHTIYTGDETDVIAEQISGNKKLSCNDIKFYFLGSGYEKAINILRTAGYSVIHQAWVDNYDDFMANMHIQIFPIIMGTGTKAKVLSAMSSGLLCIGTWYSFENIQAHHAEHYLQYDRPKEIPELLSAISQNRALYEKVAAKGKRRVLDMHDTAKVVRLILINSVRK